MDTTTQECNKCGFETDCIEGICLECRLKEEIAEKQAQLTILKCKKKWQKHKKESLQIGTEMADAFDRLTNVSGDLNGGSING